MKDFAISAILLLLSFLACAFVATIIRQSQTQVEKPIKHLTPAEIRKIWEPSPEVKELLRAEWRRAHPDMDDPIFW